MSVAQIAVQRPHGRHARRRVTDRAVIVHDVDRLGDVTPQIEPRRQYFLWRHLYHPHPRNATSLGGEQRDLMTQLGKTLTQPRDDALRAAVLRHGWPHVV